ncbi:hypothetical protein SAMN04487770_11024 [Butyrivibrio sp. ob235]|nr:hypothetical protein SAMN04487770_11024 [Butyrivibrio sp. ob235]
MEEQKIDAIIQKLLDSQYFYIVKDENIVEGEYLTCCQQVYNYEMAANRKKTNADKMRARREKQKNKQDTNSPDNTCSTINNIPVSCEDFSQPKPGYCSNSYDDHSVDLFNM